MYGLEKNPKDKFNFDALDSLIESDNYRIDNRGNLRTKINFASGNSRERTKTQVILMPRKDCVSIKYMDFSTESKLDVVLDIYPDGTSKFKHIDYDNIQFKTYADGDMKLFQKQNDITVDITDYYQNKLYTLDYYEKIIASPSGKLYAGVGGFGFKELVVYVQKNYDTIHNMIKELV